MSCDNVGVASGMVYGREYAKKLTAKSVALFTMIYTCRVCKLSTSSGECKCGCGMWVWHSM